MFKVQTLNLPATEEEAKPLSEPPDSSMEAPFSFQLDSRPLEYEYAKLSQHVYTLPPVGEKVPELDSWQVIHSWHSEESGRRVVLNQVTRPFSFADVATKFVTSVQKRITRFQGYIQRQIDFGFAAAIYVNDEKKQLVLAFRGTSDIMGWCTDFASIVNTFISPQIPLAHEATQLAIKKAQEKGYSLHITGHSLGGWLAELGLFFALIEFKTYCSAVTFESPGAWFFIKEQLLSNLPDIRAQDLELLRDFADLMSLRSYPNSFNTCNLPLGTVKALYPPVLDRSRLPLVYIAEVHSIDRIVEGYERNDPIAPTIMADWPEWSNLSQHYKISDFENERWLVDEEKYSAFDRYYRAHYKIHDRLNNQNCIHIRHFHSDTRGALIKLNERLMLKGLSGNRREMLKTELVAQIGLTEDEAKLLAYYEIDDHCILSVKDAISITAEDFRKEISKLFQTHFNEIEAIIYRDNFVKSSSVIPIFADKQTAKDNSRIDNTVVEKGGEMVVGDAKFAATIYEAMSKIRAENKLLEQAAEPKDQQRPFAREQLAQDSAIIGNSYVLGRFFQQRELPPVAQVSHTADKNSDTKIIGVVPGKK